MLSVMRVAALLAVAILLAVPGVVQAKKSSVAAAGPPADYTQTRNLTQPRYETSREVIRVPAFDGEELYLEVVRPNRPPAASR